MSAAVPWWASDEHVNDIDEQEDAFRAHRRARLDDVGETSVPPAAPDWVELLGDVAVGLVRRVQAVEGDRAPVDHAHGTGEDSACRNCPVCILLRAVEQSGSDVTEHLGDAARHLALAAASFLEALAERPGDEPEAGS